MNVGQPDLRGLIDLLLSELPGSSQKNEEAVAKVKQIATILEGDPVLKNDATLIDRVFTAIDAMLDENIQEKCKVLLLGKEPVILSIPEHELENYG